eukprot:5917250-Heterocapsa_arctica.AAC.1
MGSGGRVRDVPGQMSCICVSFGPSWTCRMGPKQRTAAGPAVVAWRSRRRPLSPGVQSLAARAVE